MRRISRVRSATTPTLAFPIDTTMTFATLALVLFAACRAGAQRHQRQQPAAQRHDAEHRGFRNPRFRRPRRQLHDLAHASSGSAYSCAPRSKLTSEFVALRPRPGGSRSIATSRRLPPRLATAPIRSNRALQHRCRIDDLDRVGAFRRLDDAVEDVGIETAGTRAIVES
jgi:hypothetical protein